jgi:hypothetical protein
MVSNCANPKCAKPLHYLREGRIFVFDVMVGTPGSNGKRSRRMEHYWLCGVCSKTMAMEQTPDGVRVISRQNSRLRGEMRLAGTAMAS